MQQDAIVRDCERETPRVAAQSPSIPDPATDPLGAYLHAELTRMLANEFPNRKPAQFI
jgi:hypothetical protein